MEDLGSAVDPERLPNLQRFFGLRNGAGGVFPTLFGQHGEDLPRGRIPELGGLTRSCFTPVTHKSEVLEEGLVGKGGFCHLGVPFGRSVIL